MKADLFCLFIQPRRVEKEMSIESGVPQNTPRFDDLLEWIKRLSTQSYSGVWFITAKEYKIKLEKEKEAWSGMERKPHKRF